MNDILAAEIEGIVDKQLQDCGFIDLCTRIAQKVVEKVQRIEEDHGIIKSELNGIEEKLNVLLSDKIPLEKAPQEKIPQEKIPQEPKLPSVKKDVIVIEEEEEDNKSLVTKLHEITKSSQMLSFTTDFASPPKKQLNQSVDEAMPNVVSSTYALTKETSTICTLRQRAPLGRQYAGAKRNSAGVAVFSEVDKGRDLSQRMMSTGAMQTEKELVKQKDLAPEAVDLTDCQDDPKSPIVDDKPSDGQSSHVSPDDSMPRSGEENKSAVDVCTGSVVNNLTLNNESSVRMMEDTSNVKQGRENVAGKQPQPSSNVLPPEELSEASKIAEKEAENQDGLVSESYEYEEGHRVLGKPDKSDIWYTAQISKILVNKYNQKKYQVKFESGLKMHGTLPGNSLAPIAHPKPSSINIGSRVVAIRPRDTVDARIQKKYLNLYSSDFAKGEILFGGVVMERSCEENRHRFLIVFDDGFAQYMTEKKMHLVIHSAENVWQDVSAHCREFIKEYLEEYPKRPMLEVKPGLSIQTEWNGKWLQAKVIAVDCSLVKMLFDVDKRTEWIYRGSTRLEPLYSELERRDLEALKPKNRKSNKRKRPSNVKKVEPYVDDAITKPCFGISRFSKTDPRGMQQIKEWGPVVEKPVATQLDESTISDSDSNVDSPMKLIPDRRPIDFQTRKRKVDGVPQEASASTLNIENETGIGRTPTTKDLIIGSPPITSQTTPENSPSPNDSPARRRSSQSSIDSVSSDSQLLLRNKRQVRFERQTSNHSIQSSQSDRTDLHVQHSSAHVRGNQSGVNMTSKPGSAVSTQIVAISRANATMPKLPTERNLVARPVQRLILPRPIMQPQQPIQFWRIPEGVGAFPLPQVFVPRLAISQFNLSPVAQFQPQITAVPLGAFTQSFQKVKGPHDCSKSCILHVRLPPIEKQKHNPLSIPLILGWTRETAKRKPGYHRDIYYRTPCSRRLRNMAEVSRFLLRTGASNVTIDQFSFDSSVSCRDHQIPVPSDPYFRIDDISYGKEKIPISCVNEKSQVHPPIVEYISNRIIGQGININTDQGFLACCDCKDNCQDKAKCACVRLTIDSSDAIDGKKDQHSGYYYRRLKECVTTGIYECNQNCSCSATCYNRVVQNGIGIRLQVFMTDSKGWGLRCLDDIPRGTFICTYSGQILNEEMADKEGKDYGDEYLAELDHIEIVEKAKEGYESDVPELRRGKKPERSRSFESSSKGYESSDSEGSDLDYSTSPESTENLVNTLSFKELALVANKSHREKRRYSSNDVIDLTLESDAENENGSDITNGKLDEDRRPSAYDSKTKEYTQKSPSPKFFIEMDSSDSLVLDEDVMLEKNEKNSNSSGTDHRSMVDAKFDLKSGWKGEVNGEKLKVSLKRGLDKKNLDAENSMTRVENWNCEVTKAIETIGPNIRKAVARKSTRSILFQRLANTKRSNCNDDGINDDDDDVVVDDDDDDDDDDGGVGDWNGSAAAMSRSGFKVNVAPRVVELVSDLNPGKTFTSPRSSTGGHFARKAIKLQITPPSQHTSAKEPQQPQQNSSDIQTGMKSSRRFFGEDQCYVIDAKSFGNIGRYLNHSCMPNLFVQNVFIDSHDLRFPFVAFFAQQNIPALSELTWDYSYEVGSVPGKVLQCYCGANECRGRLL